VFVFSVASVVLVPVLAIAVVALVIGLRKSYRAAVILAAIGAAVSVLGIFAAPLDLPVVVGALLFVAALTLSVIAIVFSAIARPVSIFVNDIDPTPTANYRPTNTLAIVSLIVVFPFSAVGLVLGYVALAQIKKTRENGRPLALAAVVVGWILSAIWIFFVGTFVVEQLARHYLG
jgi:hypothetical protein